MTARPTVTDTPRAAERPADDDFRAIFDAVPIGLALVDPTRKIIVQNAALERINGYDAESFNQLSPLEIIHPDDRSQTVALVEDLRAGRRDSYTMEKRIRHRDGSWRWIRVSVTAVRDADGAILRTISTNEDITERKVAEAALRAGEERFRALIANAADVVAIVAPDGASRYGSPALPRLLGFGHDVPPPTETFGLVHPDDLSGLRAALRACASMPQAQVECAYRLRARDGTWRQFEATLTNRLDDPAIDGLIVNARDVTARKEAEAQLLHWTFHDPLTNLPNRLVFMDRATQALNRARRGHEGVALVTIDIDRFKLINDSLGHDVGDDLIAAVGRRLDHLMRDGDTVAHLNGDLFALLVEGVRDASEALAIGERVRAAFGRPFAVGGREVTLSASLGIALSGRGRHTAEELLRDADSALSRAKARGKGRCELFDARSGAAAFERLELEQDLRRAIEAEAFQLVYQPQLDLRTGRLDRLETLIRWHDPRRGAIAPGQFIPVAEETGLIVLLGRWVLREACRQAATWAARDGYTPTIAVNLSVREFQVPDLAGEVGQILAETGLPPERLQLEITESVAIDDLEGAIATLNALRGLGLRLALDDFGAGHSSLSYLQRLPIDTLKLDRAFLTDDGPAAARGRAIIPAITALAHALGLAVVAEGVESGHHLTLIRLAGCDWGQGYHIGRPVPAEELRASVMSR
jgi:diguanylate cyclase (GGDEF)-like protein/PAS domain S-box-containing protein